MDTTILHTVWTVVAFVFFIGIVIWAWSSNRKSDFEKAAKMAVDDTMNEDDDCLNKKV